MIILSIEFKTTIFFQNFSKSSTVLCRNSLRNLISYVAQKPYIFSGTIRENILLGDPFANEDEIIEAATRAGIFTFDEIALLKQKEEEKKEIKVLRKNTDFSQSLPNINNLLNKEEEEKEEKIENFSEMKLNKMELTREKKIEILNTKTVPRGTNLSGGFQQSVALARVFLKKHAKLFILDESTSAMDPIKKRQIIMPELLKFSKENKITLIIISHDMSDLKYADQLVLLELGKIVCKGAFEEVSKNRRWKICRFEPHYKFYQQE